MNLQHQIHQTLYWKKFFLPHAHLPHDAHLRRDVRLRHGSHLRHGVHLLHAFHDLHDHDHHHEKELRKGSRNFYKKNQNNPSHQFLIYQIFEI